MLTLQSFTSPKSELPESSVAIPASIYNDIFLGFLCPAKHFLLPEYQKSRSEDLIFFLGLRKDSSETDTPKICPGGPWTHNHLSETPFLSLQIG